MMWLSAIEFWHWWILAMVLIVLELFAPGAFFLWLGFAAGAVGLLLWMVPAMEWQYQLLLFAVLSVVMGVLGRRYVRLRPIPTDHPTLNQRGEQYVGRLFTLAGPIVNGRGKLHVDDTMWSISGPNVEAGVQVKVVGVDGTVLQVQPLKKV